ncbi:MAG: Asp-tRNA(Asn)/Glu-tRNA(Gln) amidotransferase subunit GatA [Firmicutes bacterium]|nr:Asp-tRNA(Asn)/Glu-tRNA(Gln) amidotransferase subunit GatA [Bacillota bacterium]
MDISKMTALETAKMIKSKQISVKETVKCIIDNIKKNDDKINAYITITEENALRDAETMQKKIDSGEETGIFAGVPFAIKDNICTKDIKTTCASKMLENFVPIYDATAVGRIKDSGAIPLGKLNMDEFGMGGSNENSYFGVCRNPYDTERVPGGSSGGAASAVAADEALFALASDTGGSIRQPCSFCGVSGIKPTYGTVSRYGLVAFASSLDQIGAIGRDIKDCAAVLSVIGGYDRNDPTSIKNNFFDFSDCFNGNIKGTKIGIPQNYIENGIDVGVKEKILESAKIFESLGADIEFFVLPLCEYAVAAYYVISCAEASSNLSRYDGIRYGYKSANAENISDIFINSRSDSFGEEVKRRIMLGSFVLSAGHYDDYYKKASQVRTMIKTEFEKAFEKYDIILAPAAPTTAYKIGENSTDPLRMYLGDIYTVSVSLAGIPAAVIPCGMADGLPVGVQLIGKAFDEKNIIKTAYAFQMNTDFHKTRKGAL